MEQRAPPHGRVALGIWEWCRFAGLHEERGAVTTDDREEWLLIRLLVPKSELVAIERNRLIDSADDEERTHPLDFGSRHPFSFPAAPILTLTTGLVSTKTTFGGAHMLTSQSGRSTICDGRHPNEENSPREPWRLCIGCLTASWVRAVRLKSSLWLEQALPRQHRQCARPKHDQLE